MSEVDVIVAHMDRVLCEFMTMECQRGDENVSSAVAGRPEHLSGDGSIGSHPLALPSLPGSDRVHR